jgi:hypothetical protein
MGRNRLVKPLAAGLAAAVGIAAGVAVAGTSSTELGDTTTAPVYGANSPVVQFATTPGSKSYTTPDGVLTKWRYHSSGDMPAGSIQLQLYQHAGGPGVYKAVAESDVKTLEPNRGYEFSERIPVQAGYILGLNPDMDSEVAITVPASGTDLMYQFAGEVPVGSTGTATGPFPEYRVNVSATVEPDADGDGYGDESQDGCPTDASIQTACPDREPPNTEISKKPKRRLDKTTAKFRFKSTEAGSTFECALKGKGVAKRLKKFKPCDSGRAKYRELAAGKKRFRVRAVDPAGNVDPTPAKAKFSVVG